MKTYIAVLFVGLILIGGNAMGDQNNCGDLLNNNIENINGTPENTCKYKGKVLLVVNTASQCGFTGQYKELESLYQKYKDQGFSILGFPSNDFGSQEPGTNAEIKQFCERNYGVSFPMFSKTSVTKENPFYAKLSQVTGQSPRWNFHKYLIDKEGKKVVSLPSNIAPNDKQLIDNIEALLK